MIDMLTVEIEIISIWPEKIIKDLYENRFKNIPFVYQLIKTDGIKNHTYHLTFNSSNWWAETQFILAELQYGNNLYVAGILNFDCKIVHADIITNNE